MNRIFLLVFAAILSTLNGQNFTEVTESTGLIKATHSNGIAVADYDLDGDLDIYIVCQSRYNVTDETTWNRLFENNGNGTFIEVTEKATVRGAASSPNIGFEGTQYGAAWGDYDSDGDPDLYITNFGYNILYRNNGNSTFTNITDSAGVKGGENDLSSTPLWWDYDLDGDLDLYVSTLYGVNILYENNGQGVFSNVAKDVGLNDDGSTWTSMPFDANNDHLPDLYVVNDYGANTFYLNQGDKTFEKMTAEFGLENEGHGMGVTLADYNNDGYFDIYLTNISSFFLCPLFENQGNGTFIDKAKIAGIDDVGWAWGTEFFDFDHDGGLDLYVANGHSEERGNNFLFYNLLESNKVEPDLQEPKFWDISDSSSVNSRIEARALITFDYDDDGDLDLLVGNFWNPPHLFENQSESKNWLKIKLEGTVSNRDAFGSVVSLTCGEKKYFRSNDGVDFLGQSILPLHFGLANTEYIDTITVTWPTGQQEFITNIQPNQTIKIVENQGLISGIQNDQLSFFKPEFYLIGNYPNPFNSSTRILFNIPMDDIALLKVFNTAGEEIYNRDFTVKKGHNTLNWNGNNTNGNPVSSGLYLYTLSFNNSAILSGKLVLIK